MNLSLTTDKLEFQTFSATATIDFVTQFSELDTTTKDWSQSSCLAGTITGVSAATDVSGSPAAGKVRRVESIVATNTHVSLAQDVQPQLNRNTVITKFPRFTLQPNECLEWDNDIQFFVVTPVANTFGDVIERRLDAAQTGQNIATVQPWIPTNGAPNVEAGVVYDLEGLLSLTRSAGVTSHTTAISFGGTATLTSILWDSRTNTGDTLANAAKNGAGGKSAASVVVKAASVSASEEIMLRVDGTVKVNAAGTFIPQFTYSAIPGGAPTVNVGSFFTLTKKGVGFNTKGIWA